MTDPHAASPPAPRPCPAPDPAPGRPTRFAMPAGAVDCHAHVIGGPPEAPLVPDRSYDPPPAPEAAYLAMLDATGMARGVLVQVSVHGTDNRLMLATLRRHPDRLRGVAVVSPDLPEAGCRDLAAAGVVGLRLNLLFRGGVGLDRLEDYGALCRRMGWHLQLLIDARDLTRLGPRLARLDVPLVFDHLGHVPADAAATDPGFEHMVGMVRDGAWVKLSGAFRLDAGGPPWPATIPMARRLAAAAPERCVWGSDWPHVAHWGTPPKIGALLDLLADWVPDAAALRAVLVDNPARLYGFPPPG